MTAGDEDDYEHVLLVKPEIFVYRIPPLSSAKGHKAADWQLDSPDWTGRLRMTARGLGGKRLELRLEDRASGQLYAKCPVEAHPSVAVEPVADSSRYFVIRLKNDNGQTAFVGMGFADRGDSFDFNVALQDHFKHLETEAAISREAEAPPQPKLDLGFKEGQTITISLGKNKGGAATARPKPAANPTGGALPFLPPPPPGGAAVRPRAAPPPPSTATTPTSEHPTNSSGGPSSLLDF